MGDGLASRRRLVGALSALGAASIWGGLYVASKYVLAYVPPLTLVAIRLAVAGAVLAGVLALAGRLRLPRLGLPLMAACGLVGYTVSLSAQFIGTHLSTAHDGALITSATPAFVALFARPLLGERVTLRGWLAIGMATAGVVVVSSGQEASETARAPLLGDVFLVVAAVTWALYSVLSKVAIRRHSALVVTTFAILFGLLFTSPLAAIEGASVDWSALPPVAWLGIAYVGVVSTAVAFYLWNKSFELLRASTASLYFFAQPVVGGLLGWLLLGEQLPVTFFVGAVAIAGGVLLASSGPSGG